MMKLSNILQWFGHPCTKCRGYIERLHELEQQLTDLTTQYNELVDEYNKLEEAYCKIEVEREDDLLLLLDE